MTRNDKQKQRQRELAIIQDTLLRGTGAGDFSTTHNLDFETAPWITKEYLRFRVGTLGGLYKSNDAEQRYEILALQNDDPGNGHFDDALQWFEYSCRRDGFDLMVDECWNKDLKKHLIKKRGFKAMDGRNAVIKDVREM